MMALEEKVDRLEELVKASSSSPTSSLTTSAPSSKEQQTESLTQPLMTFQKSVQSQWSSVQLEWKEDRERLSKAREEFQGKMDVLKGGLAKVASMQHQHMGNGEPVKAGGGLVTLPGLRSMSSDSNGGGRRRRRRSGGSRGRGRSRSENTSSATAVSISDSEIFSIEGRKPYWPDEDASDDEGQRLIRVKTKELHDRDPSMDFSTPESLVHQASGDNTLGM